MKKKKEESSSSSSSESPLSFLSLPHDIVFNTLARIPRTSYPNLSLVSKSFRSLPVFPWPRGRTITHRKTGEVPPRLLKPQ
ncbi:hypothetical protein F2Q69_00050484 [Brassica cretica]|uniref:F-box domain-containing protein n=1 Tax=Brassica cretica TaxID=69181 RepID=A0A8S9PP29_BRACR|nr:hypothetical protein F2Q69_00050484 [Brassica cretica]